MDCTDLKYDFIHNTIRESSTISVSFKKIIYWIRKSITGWNES